MLQRGQLSPDGYWMWDGGNWIPAPGASPAAAAAGWQRGYAGFFARFAAAFIDGLVLLPLWIAAGVLGGIAGALTTPDKGGGGGFANLLSYPVFWGGAWLYFALMESSRQQATLGKMALGLVVTDAAGNRVTFARATGRFFAKFLSALICYAGFVMAAFTARKQALHDMVAGTLVLNRNPGPALAGGAGTGVAVMAVTGAVAVLVLTSIVVIVILLTMGSQIKNVFSNVVVALGGG